MVEMRMGRVIGIFVRSVPGLMLVSTNQFQIGLNSSFFNCFFLRGSGGIFFPAFVFGWWWNSFFCVIGLENFFWSRISGATDLVGSWKKVGGVIP